MHEMTSEKEPMMDEDEHMGIDSIISRVESYIGNPKLVTPETLTELKEELVDLKEYLDGNDKPEEPGEESHGGLTIVMGKAIGRNK